MKIIWNENPLKTKIFLDDNEKELLKYKLIANHYLDVIYDISYYYARIDERSSENNLEKFINILDDNHISYHKSDELKNTLNSYIDELENGFHVGDCTCIPCTCYKCVAEDLVGFNTIKNLRPHSANKVNVAFTTYQNIDDAISYLEKYNPVYDSKFWHGKKEIFDANVDRWIKEARFAAQWLTEYKNKHDFNDVEYI